MRAQERGLHLAAWSMMGAIALFVGVVASLVPVVVWSMSPPEHNAAWHPGLTAQALGAPLGLIVAAGALAVTASLVVFGVAAAFLRSPQSETILLPVERR